MFNLEGIQAETLDVELNSKFDMEFHWLQQDNGLTEKLIYSRDIFDKSSAQTILSTFVAILTYGLRAADVTISTLSLTQPTDYMINSKLDLPRENISHYPRDANVIDVFQHQVTMHHCVSC